MDAWRAAVCGGEASGWKHENGLDRHERLGPRRPTLLTKFYDFSSSQIIQSLFNTL